VIAGIDESGSFVTSPTPGSWCVVAAYVLAERKQSQSLAALSRLKKRSGLRGNVEIKLKQIDENGYFDFLFSLHSAGGLLFSAATDSHLNTPTVVMQHRNDQADRVRINVPRMRYEAGRQAVTELASKVEALSPQLYVQLVCQVELLHDIVRRAILYLVQRDPKCLRRFKWRIDQKNSSKTDYEHAFEQIAPALLQTISFREPMICLKGADYSFFQPYQFTADEVPDYLQEEYGIEPEESTNVGKLIRENMKFADSKCDLIVQIADLLASGIRRALRGEFLDNKRAARLLGRLTVSNSHDKSSIRLLTLAQSGGSPTQATERVVKVMTEHARPMLAAS
jgi:hypothetical protein